MKLKRMTNKRYNQIKKAIKLAYFKDFVTGVALKYGWSLDSYLDVPDEDEIKIFLPDITRGEIDIFNEIYIERKFIRHD